MVKLGRFFEVANNTSVGSVEIVKPIRSMYNYYYLLFILFESTELEPLELIKWYVSGGFHH